LLGEKEKETSEEAPNHKPERNGKKMGNNNERASPLSLERAKKILKKKKQGGGPPPRRVSERAGGEQKKKTGRRVFSRLPGRRRNINQLKTNWKNKPKCISKSEEKNGPNWGGTAKSLG